MIKWKVVTEAAGDIIRHILSKAMDGIGPTFIVISERLVHLLHNFLIRLSFSLEFLTIDVNILKNSRLK